MLDRPQDACFFDWHLLDAKDSPFASFRIHYRSWKSLKELNLIPATELELLCAVSPKALKTIAKTESVSKLPDNKLEEQSFLSGNSDESVFRDYKEDPDGNTGHYFLKSPPELFPAMPSNMGVPQPSKVQRDAYRESYLQRPLPELPVEESSRLSRRSSAASAMSATLSIAPSLLHYADEASLNPEDIEVGIAQVVQVPLSESGPSITQNEEPDSADYSISDYETSPKSAGDSFLGENLSPGHYLPMTGSGLERGIALFTSPKSSIFSRASSYRQSLPSKFNTEPKLERLKRSVSNASNLSPLLCRTKGTSDKAMGDPVLQKDRGGGRHLFAGLRNRSIGSPRKLVGMALGLDVPKTDGAGNVVQRAMGNWI